MISNYQLISRINNGNHGSIYTAKKNGSTGTTYAIKKIPKLQFNKESKYWISNEITNIQKTQSSRFVNHVYEVIDQSDAAYIVQDFCTAGSLYDNFVHHGPYSERAVTQITYQILDALVACYVNDIVFSDLKMKNIMVFSQQQPEMRLVDFGSSQICKDGEHLQRDKSTPTYAAPEVFQGHFDKSVDMWGVGIIMYKALTGRYPFWKCSWEEVEHMPTRKFYRGLVRNDVIFDETMSESVQDLLSTLLAKDPSKRMNPIQAVRHPVFAELHKEVFVRR